MRKFLVLFSFVPILLISFFSLGAMTLQRNYQSQQTTEKVRTKRSIETGINETDFINTMFLRSTFFENWSETNYFINPTLKTSQTLTYNDKWYLDFLKDSYSTGISFDKPSDEFMDLYKNWDTYSDLQAKLQDFLSKNYQNKYYKRIKKKIFAYINLCKEFFLETKLLLKDLIKKYFKNKFSTFYYWANKILLAYANNNFEDLLLKSTVPNNINYQYSNDVRKNICDLYFEYCNKHAGGVLSLYYNLKKGIHGEELKNKAPKNLKTFFRWLKKDKRWLKIKNKIKEIKRQQQMDAKYFMPSKFPVDKKYYVYDFIDERIRGVFGYIYDKFALRMLLMLLKEQSVILKKYLVLK